MADHYARPPTPQAMVHRLPDKPDASANNPSAKPSKFIVLIAASTAVAGKVQVAQSVSRALGSSLFQGDSLHETAARAAWVGASSSSSANEARYRRMWLTKMTRTGLLFPGESRAAGAGFSGFGGASGSRAGGSSRPYSRASDASDGSFASDVTGSSFSTQATSVMSGDTSVDKTPAPVAHESDGTQQRQANPILMVLTHSELQTWHRDCIRAAVGEYGIGVIFVPLDEDAEPPVLRPLDPTKFASFGALGTGFGRAVARSWDEEVVLSVDVDATVEDRSEEIVNGVRDIINS